MVKRQTIEHFAQVETDPVSRPFYGASNLLEHRLIVNVDLDKRSILSIDEREVTVRATERAPVRERDQLVIGPATDTGAELAIKISHKRRIPADH